MCRTLRASKEVEIFACIVPTLIGDLPLGELNQLVSIAFYPLTDRLFILGEGRTMNKSICVLCQMKNVGQLATFDPPSFKHIRSEAD